MLFCINERLGSFSSSALTMIAKGIDGLVQNEGKIQIIASPRLSTSDIEEIRKGYEVRKIIEKSLIREISDIEDQEDIEKLSYIARLVADGILDVKIAFLTTKNEIAMYHEKMGLITDSDGNTVAFSGSMNESENAFKDNYESFDAFCSWTNDSERVFQKQMAFKAIWEDYKPGVETIASFVHLCLSDEKPDMKGIWGPYDGAVLDNMWLLEGGQISASGLVNWFRHNFHIPEKDGNPYGNLLGIPDEIPIGADGVTVLDFFQGNRTPYKDAMAKGVIFGLNIKHTWKHIYRAVLESVSYGTQNIIRNLKNRDIR